MSIKWQKYPEEKPRPNQDLLVHGRHYPEDGNMYYHCEYHKGKFYNGHAFSEEPAMHRVTHWAYINDPENEGCWTPEINNCDCPACGGPND